MLEFKLDGEEQNREPMARYMKNQFPFLGAKSPERKLQERPLLIQSKDWTVDDIIDTIAELYRQPEREYQYAAIDLAQRNFKRFTLPELQSLVPFVIQKPWWDTVDSWRKVFGSYVIKYPDTKAEVFSWFFQNENFWLRRLSIILQLTEKATLDTAMLTEAIEYDLTTSEFFIQKAIGWALRNYSKVNPGWVGDFLATHEMSKLAEREAGKYLER